MLKNFDFSLLESKDFKEDSVRAFIIDKILEALGFVLKNDKKPQKLEMVLSKTLKTQNSNRLKYHNPKGFNA